MFICILTVRNRHSSRAKHAPHTRSGLGDATRVQFSGTRGLKVAMYFDGCCMDDADRMLLSFLLPVVA